MNTSTKIALAVAGGYLLGRRKKAKLAVLLGSALLGKRLDMRELGREAVGRLADSPEVSQIRDEVRGQLASTGRAAASAALSAPLNQLADKLHERTARLSRGPSDESAGRPEREADAETAETSREERDEEHEQESARGRRPTTRRTARETAQAARSRGRERAPAGTSGGGSRR